MRISLHIVVALLLIALIYREILKGIVYCLLYAEITGTAATVSGERWFDSSGLSCFFKKKNIFNIIYSGVVSHFKPSLRHSPASRLKMLTTVIVPP